MRRALAGFGVLAAAATIAVLGIGGSNSSSGRHYRLVFDNAFGLVEGGDFRVGGVRAGSTTSFDVTKTRSGRPVAIVNAKVTEDGFGDFRRDATCEIRPQSLIGEYYVDCQPGSSRRKLPSGGTVPVTQTSSTIPVDVVQDIMRAPYRDRFRILITELGTGLAGRSADLSEVLRRAHPGLRETQRVLRILGDQNRALRSFLTNADTVVGEVERNKRDVVRWVRETRRAAEITATRREALRGSIRRLPGFLDELRPTMAALRTLTDEQTPLLRDLHRGAPAATTFLQRLRPFARAARPSLRTLGEASLIGTRAVRAGGDEVATLRQMAGQAVQTGQAPNQQGFARPLRQFLQALDDRRRAPETTPRAPATAPPAPDPTAIPSGQAAGFTTFEDFWDYTFWQTLAVNGYDATGHMLRVTAVAGECSPWQTGPRTAANQKVFDDCNQWLGPNQPGVTTPDPTRSGNVVAPRNATSTARPGQAGAAGQAEAPPQPGQPDRSRPQPTLPPKVPGLLDRAGADGGRQAAAPAQGAAGRRQQPTAHAAGQLLDYLLGP